MIYTLKEYQDEAARTIDADLPKYDMVYHALFGMCSEVGELHALYQKIYQGHEREVEHAKKEVGDILWFIAEYCTAMGWNLDEIATMNIKKLRNRYPEGFDPDRSLHRKQGDI